MADGLRAACRNFEPSRLNKDRCQNCNKLKDSHGKPASSQESLGHGLTRKGSGARVSRLRTVVKSGALTVAVQKGNDNRLRWNKRWIVLDSTGTVEYFSYDEQNDRSGDVLEGFVNLDTCGGMFVGEYDTREPFSTGLKFPDSTLFFKAENRLEMDNWSRVLKPFVQAAQPLPSRRTSRPSSSSSEPGTVQSSALGSDTGYVPSSGKTSLGRSVTLPRATIPRSQRLGIDEEHASVESLKSQLEKLKEENKKLSEQSGHYARQAESAHILEQELKSKNHQLKELEKKHCQCKDYQKAVIFQERELQEAKTNIKGLKKELEEAEKNLKQQKGKMSATGKELLEAKSDLQQADSIISIHKANIESLKSELGSLKQDASTNRGKGSEHDDPVSHRRFTERSQTNGDDREGDQTRDLETKLSFLMQKFKQNERELTIKGKELEKANESRSKVAKYTRSLLQELEMKLGQNEKRLSERDNELVNLKLELEYEKEERVKLQANNERALSELEKLHEERRKMGLSKEVVKLLDQAKEKTAVESVIPVKAEMAEAGLEFFPEEASDQSDDLRNELTELKTALKLMESQVNEKESMLNENQAVLESTNTEINRLREERNSLKHELQVAKCDELTDLLKRKDSEIGSLKKDIRYLSDMNSDLSEKNRGLDERLQTVENELNESVEKEIILQQENETRDEESTDFEEKIAGLEEELSIATEKITSLKLKLTEALNEPADKNKVEELELAKELEQKLLQREEQVEALREKYESDLSNFGKGRTENQKYIRDLERQLQNVEESLEEVKTKLGEKEKELEETVREFKTQVDHSQVEELETKLIEKEEVLSEYEQRLRDAEDEISEYQTELNSFKSQRKSDTDEYVQELENKLRFMEEEVQDYKKRLAAAEFDIKQKPITSGLQTRSAKENGDLSLERLDGMEKKLVDAVEKIEKYEEDIQRSNSKLKASEQKVVELAEELSRRLKQEGETVQWIEEVESSLNRREVELNEAREVITSKAKELDKEKINVLDSVELSTTYTKELEAAVNEERNTVRQLQEKLLDERSKTSELHAKIESLSSDRPDGSRQREDLEAKLISSQRQLDAQTAQISALKNELKEQEAEFNKKLEAERQSFEAEVQRMNEDSLSISGAANTEADELKLRLTSRVITLQSDISELKAAHQEEIEQLKAHYKKLEQDRNEAILESSAHLNLQEETNSSIQEWEADMRLMVERYETHMEHLKASHDRDMAKLKRSSDSGDGLQTEVVQLQTEMEGMNQKYLEEIEMLKNEHAEELEQLKADMAVVLQASQATKPTEDSTGNVPQLKARIRELEGEMEELSRKYNEEIKAERDKQQREIEQTREDMMTVIQAIRSEKYKLDSDAEEDASPRRARELQRELEKTKSQYEAKLTQQKQEHEKQLEEIRINRGLITITGVEDTAKLHKRINELEAELADMRDEFADELSRKEEEHGDEVNQLKVDMLVAIQAARSGNSSPVPAQPDNNTVMDTISQAGVQLSLEEARQKIGELEEKNKALKKEISVEKEEAEKTKQKSDAAVMFGLRRNEDMSMKIYRMQKEMEAMESKHQKEVNMYREAVEREKEKKGDVGDAAELASENESLRLEIEECELNTEKRENVLLAEIEMYKDKFHKESVQNVEKLKYNIKSLEDVIEELKLEHGKELEDLKEERERTMEEIKNRHEKEIEKLSKVKSVADVASEVSLPTKDPKKEREKLRERELRIEELESLLNVKKRRHSEEMRKLRERLQQELQSHTDEVRDYRRRIRELERSRPRSDSGGQGLDGEYKRKLEEQSAENATLKALLEEQGAENATLKDSVEELKKQLEDLNSEMNATSKAAEEQKKPFESRRPMSEVYPSGYSFNKGTSQPAASPASTKEPLRKVFSDSRMSDPQPSYRRGQQKPGGSEKSKTFPRGESKWQIARQSSKIDSNSIGSVASRVALYQTAVSKNKEEDKTVGKKP